MIRTSWVAHKKFNSNNIDHLLENSIMLNQMSNYGPLVRKLELFLASKLGISNKKSVIVVNNGACGLNALVSGINLTFNRKLKYATQAFAFPCVVQGPLEDSEIIDLDENLMLNLTQLTDNIDGFIVTNLFGNVGELEKYINYANKYKKILLFDNATVPLTLYQGTNANNYGVGSIISLHHTKILGYGEGGAIIVDKRYEENIRKCINFGFEITNGKINYHKYGGNYKMSEISAAAILSHLEHIDEIILTNNELYVYCNIKLESLNMLSSKKIKLFPNYGDGIPLISCFAFIFPFPITNDHILQFEYNYITAKKYYSPLLDLPISIKLYNNILCLPCHTDINTETIDRYINIMENFINQN